jgi:multiple antibiotic resistance protein
LIALRTALDVYTLARARPAAPASADTPPTLTQLAFSPLAFPTIIPPFGIGIVVLLLALAQERGAMATLAGMFATILFLDLLAMLFADWIMRAPFIKYALYTLGAAMSVLQVSLAVQAIADSIRELNIF